MNKKVSVIIPTLGDEAHLKRLLHSIDCQAVDFSTIEVLLIANGQSSEEFLKFKNNFSQPRAYEMFFHHLESPGVSAARNLGLEKARGELVFFFDDDCELHLRNTLSYHVEQHGLRADLFALGGGYLLPSEAGLFDEIYNHIQMSWFMAGQAESNRPLKPTKYLLGGNFSAKSKILKQYGIRFDDSIAYGGSESALFKQAVIHALSMCACPVEVTHHTAESAGSIRRKVYKQGRGQALINLRYPHSEGAQDTRPAKQRESDPRFGFWLLFYNYVFWSGYFSAEGRPFKIAGKLFSDLAGKFHGWRFGLVDRLNQKK